jgi:hypothetical protein
MGTAGVRWAVTLVLGGIGCWFAIRAARPESTGPPPGAGERLTHVAHAAMAAVMIVMTWSPGATGSM